MRLDLDEPGTGDAGQGRVSGAIRLDEELNAVAVLDREVPFGLDRVRDCPVRARRRVGRDRGNDRRRAQEDQRSLDQLSLCVLDRDVDVDWHVPRRHGVRVERDLVDDEALAGGADVLHVDNTAAAAATAAAALLDDCGRIRVHGCLAVLVLRRDLEPDRVSDIRLHDRIRRLGRARDLRAFPAASVASQPLVGVRDVFRRLPLARVAGECAPHLHQGLAGDDRRLLELRRRLGEPRRG